MAFGKHHHTIDRLLLPFESVNGRKSLEIEGVYVVGSYTSKKAFDMVSREHLWKRIGGLRVPSEYICM